jgi:hypothetical protein
VLGTSSLQAMVNGNTTREIANGRTDDFMQQQPRDWCRTMSIATARSYERMCTIAGSARLNLTMLVHGGPSQLYEYALCEFRTVAMQTPWPAPRCDL